MSCKLCMILLKSQIKLRKSCADVLQKYCIDTTYAKMKKYACNITYAKIHAHLVERKLHI
jgi:hypothetical protein